MGQPLNIAPVRAREGEERRGRREERERGGGEGERAGRGRGRREEREGVREYINESYINVTS